MKFIKFIILTFVAITILSQKVISTSFNILLVFQTPEDSLNLEATIIINGGYSDGFNDKMKGTIFNPDNISYGLLKLLSKKNEYQKNVDKINDDGIFGTIFKITDTSASNLETYELRDNVAFLSIEENISTCKVTLDKLRMLKNETLVHYSIPSYSFFEAYNLGIESQNNKKYALAHYYFNVAKNQDDSNKFVSVQVDSLTFELDKQEIDKLQNINPENTSDKVIDFWYAASYSFAEKNHIKKANKYYNRILKLVKQKEVFLQNSKKKKRKNVTKDQLFGRINTLRQFIDIREMRVANYSSSENAIQYPRHDDEDFIAVDIQPEMISEHRSPYPRKALMNDEQGIVWVKALVGEDGLVVDAMLAKSSGSSILDEQTVSDALKYKYLPAIQNDRPIAIWVTYKVEYRLR